MLRNDLLSREDAVVVVVWAFEQISSCLKDGRSPEIPIRTSQVTHIIHTACKDKSRNVSLVLLDLLRNLIPIG